MIFIYWYFVPYYEYVWLAWLRTTSEVPNFRIVSRAGNTIQIVIVWFLIFRLLTKCYEKDEKRFCCPHIVTPILAHRKATNNNRTIRKSSFITHFFFFFFFNSIQFSPVFFCVSFVCSKHAYAPLTHSHMPPAPADFKFIYSFFSWMGSKFQA